MSTIQLKSEITVDTNEFLGGISQLGVSEIERFLAEVGIILARLKAPSLPTQESTLLRKIGQGLSGTIQKRYDILQGKLLAEEINAEEHQELLGLIDRVEKADADRLQSLIELSQLRQVSLDTVMNQLGIQQPPAYVF